MFDLACFVSLFNIQLEILLKLFRLLWIELHQVCGLVFGVAAQAPCAKLLSANVFFHFWRFRHIYKQYFRQNAHISQTSWHFSLNFFFPSRKHPEGKFSKQYSELFPVFSYYTRLAEVVLKGRSFGGLLDTKVCSIVSKQLTGSVFESCYQPCSFTCL